MSKNRSTLHLNGEAVGNGVLSENTADMVFKFDAFISLVFNDPGALSKTTDLGQELINNGSSEW